MVEIAKIVAKKNKLEAKSVENFLSQMFSVIDEGLHADRQVKVKGLGSFKITDVKSRESINVNTGERVMIEGHSKVTFTPDSAMKALVNKPFEQFETVIVNDDVDIAALEEVDETASEQPEETIVEAPAAKEKMVEAPVVKETVVEKSVAAAVPPVAAVASLVQEPQETSAQEDEKTPEQVTEEAPEVQIETVKAAADEVVEQPETELKTTSTSMRWLLAALLGVLIGFALGYFIGRQAARSDKEAAGAGAVVADTLTTDSVATPVEKPADALDLDKMNADPRLKYCAYDIVGVDTVITLHKGQTMKSYCNSTLGAQMIVYFQVLNDTTELGEGSAMKVPKVKVKKR